MDDINNPQQKLLLFKCVCVCVRVCFCTEHLRCFCVAMAALTVLLCKERVRIRLPRSLALMHC